MSLELYFLRSSEQKILNDMLYYAQKLDESDKTIKDIPQLEIYHNFYGLTRKDLGLYAMRDAQVCGAIWCRKLNKEHNSNGFIDEETPVVQIAVKPEFRGQGIATFMMEQFLQEVASQHKNVSVSVSDTPKSKKFFEAFGFQEVAEIKRESYLDKTPCIVMTKALELKEVVRPSDGYDPSKWLD